MPCTMWRARANRASTIPMSKRRLPPWPVRRRRPGPRAGRWLAGAGGTGTGGYRSDQPGNDPPAAKKNCLKPWRKLMWCIGVLTAQYRQRMYDLLALYARPFRRQEPVVCVDEKSKQLLGILAPPLPVQPGSAGEARLRVRPRRHLQSVRGGGTQGRAADGRGDRSPGQDRLRGLRPAPARTRLRDSAPHPFGAGQSQYPLPRVLRGRARRQGGAAAAAPRRLPLHPETRQLAEHG